MTFRLVESGWDRELRSAAEYDASVVRIVSPFVKRGALKRLLSGLSPSRVEVITRFNLTDFSEGVSDLSALKFLLEMGASVRGIRNLHAKLYLFGESKAIVTSANLTAAGLERNYEFGFVSEDAAIVATCGKYFGDLWKCGALDLSAEQVAEWIETVTHYLASGAQPKKRDALGDFGAVATKAAPQMIMPLESLDAPQAFVKFLGQGNHRFPLTHPTIDEINRAGCHWALAYPAKKRPAVVRDGAVMFISRLTKFPNDIRVFGKAIGMQHVAGRDDATDDDKQRRPFKETWSRYIRVHHGTFVAGTLENGISLNHLMSDLGANSFVSTQRNARQGSGNIDPRRAFMQQPAVELTPQGFAWLAARLDAAFQTHGTVSAGDLAELDWPIIP